MQKRDVDVGNSIYRSIFEHSGDASLLLSDNRIALANLSSLSLLDYADAGTLHAMSIPDLLLPIQPDGLSSEKKITRHRFSCEKPRHSSLPLPASFWFW